MRVILNGMVLAVASFASWPMTAGADAPATTVAPPAAATTKPTPAEIAVQAVAQYDPASMSFSDWEYVLGFRDASPANRQAADKVWKTILAKQQGGKVKLRISVLVIAAKADSIDAALTDESQAAKKTDLHVKLTRRTAAPPAAGTLVTVTGVLSSYEPKPFRFVMSKAELSAAAPVPAATTATH